MHISSRMKKLIEFARRKAKDPEFLKSMEHRRPPRPRGNPTPTPEDKT